MELNDPLLHALLVACDQSYKNNLTSENVTAGDSLAPFPDLTLQEPGEYQ